MTPQQERVLLERWLSRQADNKNHAIFETRDGVKIKNLNCADAAEILITSIGEIAEKIDVILHIEPFKSKHFTHKVYFYWNGVKFFDLFNVN